MIHPNGRTMAEAMQAGTLYSVRGAGWVDYSPPAIDTPAECVAALGRVDPSTVGARVRVDRVLSGLIGARFVEDVPGPNDDGTWTVPGSALPLCPACIGSIGGAHGGPDAPYRPASPGESCGAADCVEVDDDATDCELSGPEALRCPETGLSWHDETLPPQGGAS